MKKTAPDPYIIRLPKALHGKLTLMARARGIRLTYLVSDLIEVGLAGLEYPQSPPRTVLRAVDTSDTEGYGGGR